MSVMSMSHLKYPIARLRWRQTPCVFVITTGRSGSMTLINLLQRSRQIQAYHEPEPNRLDLLPHAFTHGFTDPKQFEKPFINARASPLASASVSGCLYVESTLLKFCTPTIAAMMPQARFLILHRHPGEVIRSAMRRGWYAGHPYDSFRPTPRLDDPARDQWEQWSAFEKNCWLWQADNRFHLTLEQSLAPHRTMRLAAADMFSAKPDRLAPLFRFLNIDPLDDQTIRSTLSQHHNQQKGGQFPTFDQWTRTQRATLDRIAGPVMQTLGY